MLFFKAKFEVSYPLSGFVPIGKSIFHVAKKGTLGKQLFQMLCHHWTSPTSSTRSAPGEVLGAAAIDSHIPTTITVRGSQAWIPGEYPKAIYTNWLHSVFSPCTITSFHHVALQKALALPKPDAISFSFLVLNFCCWSNNALCFSANPDNSLVKDQPTIN